MSAWVMPRRSPKSTCCMSMFVGFFETITRPVANMVVKTMPMLASDLTRDVPRTAKIIPTTRRAAAIAPMEKGRPRR